MLPADDDAAPEVVPAAELPEVLVGLAVDPVVEAVVEAVVGPAPQAASPTATAPSPTARSICRRPSMVCRSKDRPWSTTSSSGRGRGRPW